MALQIARVGKNNRAQVVTIPLEYRLPEGMKDVSTRKVGEDVLYEAYVAPPAARSR